jgi:hypothetical protein
MIVIHLEERRRLAIEPVQRLSGAVLWRRWGSSLRWAWAGVSMALLSQAAPESPGSESIGES